MSRDPNTPHDNDCNCGCVDDFQPVERPSLAALHRQWLDRGLPSHTWPMLLRRYNDLYGDVPQPVEHAHSHTLPCVPHCPRWGS
jgi:hypothetical protein